MTSLVQDLYHLTILAQAILYDALFATALAYRGSLSYHQRALEMMAGRYEQVPRFVLWTNLLFVFVSFVDIALSNP